MDKMKAQRKDIDFIIIDIHGRETPSLASPSSPLFFFFDSLSCLRKVIAYENAKILCY
jgi:hypothetical protein